MLANVELGGADEVPDILDEDQVEGRQVEAPERAGDHGGIQMTLAAEPVSGVEQADLGAESAEPFGVQGSLDIALDDADAEPVTQGGEGPLEQGGLARPR